MLDHLDGTRNCPSREALRGSNQHQGAEHATKARRNRPFFALLLAVSAAVNAPAFHATTIGFEGAPQGPGFTGPISESGFAYFKKSSNLFINTDGNPGHNVEPTAGTAGALEIESATAGSLFQFTALDLASIGALRRSMISPSTPSSDSDQPTTDGQAWENSQQTWRHK